MHNTVVLIGRITKDPEIRYTQSNVANVSFTIAVNRGYKDASGVEQADFINCVAWRQQADFIYKYVKKGNLLGIRGSIQQRSYQDQNGLNRYVVEVICDSVTNLTPKDQSTPSQQPVNTTYTNDDDLPF